MRTDRRGFLGALAALPFVVSIIAALAMAYCWPSVRPAIPDTTHVAGTGGQKPAFEAGGEGSTPSPAASPCPVGLEPEAERRVFNVGRRRGYQEGVRAGFEVGYRAGRQDWGRR